jgi:hypothetical protein
MFFAITEAFSSIRDFMEAGGSVLWLIAILVFFMKGIISVLEEQSTGILAERAEGS